MDGATLSPKYARRVSESRVRCGWQPLPLLNRQRERAFLRMRGGPGTINQTAAAVTLPTERLSELRGEIAGVMLFS